LDDKQVRLDVGTESGLPLSASHAPILAAGRVMDIHIPTQA